MAGYHDNFELILHDECSIDGQNYSISTSTNGLAYRVEVLENGELVDAIEVECDELRFEPQSEQHFIALYTQAHDETKDKYCTAKKTEALKSSFVEEAKIEENPLKEDEAYEVKTSFERLLERIYTGYEQIKHKIRQRGYNHRIVLPIALVGMLFFFVFMGRVLLCSDFVEQTFLTQESEKIDYFKQTESFCHKLEKGCVILSKSNMEEANIFTPEACRQWCDEAFIEEQVCALFLPYFPKKEESTSDFEEVPIALPPKKVQPKEAYVFYPKETIELFSSGTVEVFVRNHATKNLQVELVKMTLHENEYEEIVQFRKGMTSFYVNKDEEKAFKIFLEPTYYYQFDRGKYTGELTFKVKSEEGKIDEVKKDFFFRVE